ncbi:polysaccharide deacetylase family protein [Microbulbifer sp. CnH-101-G]|uniref:polysaccharide deacetylase family protein n=1 Tax=Microbulbifer sp. CnH-101-G TaxID=3243393 RepID=UPI00403A5C0A
MDKYEHGTVSIFSEKTSCANGENLSTLEHLLFHPGYISMTSIKDLYYPRDFKGYGANRPNPKWPYDARVAVSIVLNVEAGSELSLSSGDERNEAVYEIIENVENGPNLALSSHFSYGPRVGYWRVMRILDEYSIPCTVSAAGRSVACAPWQAKDVVARGHEIACHSYRWENHAAMSKQHEREIIRKAINSIVYATGVRPLGWHTKGSSSVNTRQLLVENGFLYDSDAYDDDLPYAVNISNQSHIVVPYAFDTNDMRFQAGGNFVRADDMANYCIDAFETLWHEGKEQPSLMSVGIHDRLSGRPGRIRGLIKFLEHALNRGHTWFARRIDIANHWRFISGLPEWKNTNP